MKQPRLRLGLIGKDVSKSTSERIHNFILREFGVACAYTRVSVGSSDFRSAAKTLLETTDGFNVTIPYKLDVLEFLESVQGDAATCGAVNTVVCATKTGYNTDGLGVMQMLSAAGVSVQGKRVLVLGLGGSGRSTAAALKNAGATVYAYQRNGAALQAACKELAVEPWENPEEFDGEMIINCTGVGMHDSEGVSPLSRQAFEGKETAVDLIYEPKESEFLRLAKSCGLKTVNGAAMLFYQAYYADCIYLNKDPDGAVAEALYQKFLREETGETV